MWVFETIRLRGRSRFARRIISSGGNGITCRGNLTPRPAEGRSCSFWKTVRAGSSRKKAAARSGDFKRPADLLQQRGQRRDDDHPNRFGLRGDKAVEKTHAIAVYQLAEFLVVVLLPLLQIAYFPLEVLGPARGDRLVEHFGGVAVRRQGIVIVAFEEQIECRLDIHGAIAQIE